MIRRSKLFLVPCLALVSACAMEEDAITESPLIDAEDGLTEAAPAEDALVDAESIEEAPAYDDHLALRSDDLFVDPELEASGDIHADEDGVLYRTGTAAPSCVAGDLVLTRWPLDGAAGRDWVINNHVDLDTAADPNPNDNIADNRRDYNGMVDAQAITYDGHNGIDIDISSFREMDDNSAVVRASAGGFVRFIREDQYDRNTSCTGTWNVVRIEHPNGYDTIYGHLKKNSVVVSENQWVNAGDILGVAGSSGCSSHAHLHFEVQNCSDMRVDSFQLDMWQNPQPYNQPSEVMDVMLRKGAAPTVAQIKDPAPNPTLFKPGDALGVGLSVSVRPGDAVKVSLVNPSGVVDESYTWNVGGSRYAHNFPGWNMTLGTTPGTWQLKTYINNVYKTARSFNVSNYVPGYAEVGKHGVSSSSYQTVFTDITSAGYRPIWVDGYDVNGTTYYNAIFRPADGTPWVARHNLTAADYQDEVDVRVDQGYRILQVDSYLVSGSTRYAVIFVKTSGPAWTASHGLTSSQFSSEWTTRTGQGYRAVNISVVSIGGVEYFTTLWDKASVGGWVAYLGMTESEYQTQFNTQINAGRKLAYVNAYVDNGVPRFSAIWNSQSYGSWVARHALSASGYQNEYDTWTDAGYLTRLVTGYEKNDAATFAGLWTH